MRTTISIEKATYTLSERPGYRQITRDAPYDETEYHWAFSNQAGTGWKVCKPVIRIAVRTVESDRPEEAARICLELDNAMGLTRSGGIW